MIKDKLGSWPKIGGWMLRLLEQSVNWLSLAILKHYQETHSWKTWFIIANNMGNIYVQKIYHIRLLVYAYFPTNSTRYQSNGYQNHIVFHMPCSWLLAWLESQPFHSCTYHIKYKEYMGDKISFQTVPSNLYPTSPHLLLSRVAASNYHKLWLLLPLR